jgi:hypothetical protein
VDAHQYANLPHVAQLANLICLPDKSVFAEEANCGALCPDLSRSQLYYLLAHFQPSFDHCTMELRQAVAGKVLVALKKRGHITDTLQDLLLKERD